MAGSQKAKKSMNMVEAFEKDTPHDGSIVIGKCGTDTNVYHTRFRIDRKAQRHHLSRDVIKESCTPCLVRDEKEGEEERTWRHTVWQIVSSEAVVFSLHLTALSLGALKEALDFREAAEDVHLAFSIVETIITCLVITMRVVGVRTLYFGVKKHVISVEYVSDPHSKSIHGSHLVMWLRTVSILGACLVLLSITCFILFYAFLHLGWTVLSNNVCLLLISVSTALFQDRLVLVMGRIREDQHKAVIYESLLLLKECSAASANPTKHKEYSQKASDFSLAVAETELFTKPVHIFIDDQSIKKTDVVSNL